MFISLGRAQLDTEDVTDHRTFISSQVPAGAGGGGVGEQLASRRGLRTQACGAPVCQTFALRVAYVPWAAPEPPRTQAFVPPTPARRPGSPPSPPLARAESAWPGN